MTVALRLLTDRRRALMWWAIAVTGLVLFTVSLYPSLKQQASIDELVTGLPEAFQTMVGYQAGVSLTSPAGFLHARLFATVLPVLLLALGIGAGARAIGGAEEAGTLEPLLANPVSRRRVALERYAAVLVQLVGVVGVFAAALMVLAPRFGALGSVAPGTLAVACTAVFGLVLVHATLAFAVGAATGRHGPAVAVAAAVAVIGYLTQSLLTAEGAGGWARGLSPWSWYLDGNILIDGPSPVALWGPIPLCAVLLAAGVARFCRRDLR
ncbi:ABC transporter permease subunit [Actinomadura sp. 21ATH]|uniref:ABC transporter permease subunit n=1 Tax=Actinomadura sp. 21ATH TaxID=1735444 RepID=UPI0035C1D5C7